MRHAITLRSLAGVGVLVALLGVGCSGNDKTRIDQGDLGGDAGPDTFVLDTGGFQPDVAPEAGDASDLTSLELIPSNATIFIDTATSPPTPAVLRYVASIVQPDGSKVDVSSDLSMTLDDPSLGTFIGPELTTIDHLPDGTLGVSTIARATADGKPGAAALTIVQLRKTGDKRDFYFVEPYGKDPTPSRDVLKFGTNIKQADLAFSIDTTGSMGGAISSLTSSLSTTIFPALSKAIPSVGLAVVDHKDYGDPWVVKVLQTISTDVKKAQAAVATMSPGYGGDEPEAQISSMDYILTGSGTIDPAIPKHTPPTGYFGGVDFRPGSLPVVVEITDAHWHDPSGTVALTDLEKQFVKTNARFVGVTETHGSTSLGDLEDQPNALSDSTKSNVPVTAFGGACGKGMCCTGVSGAARAPDGPKGTCRLNFEISNGTGLSDSIVNAIQAISAGTTFDVTAVVSNDPTNPGGVDATQFIQNLRAMAEGDPLQGCPPASTVDTDGDGVDDTFVHVTVGSPVCFEVIPKTNTTVPPTDQAQFFNAFIDVLGQPGAVKLDRRNVLFLVPPKDVVVAK